MAPEDLQGRIEILEREVARLKQERSGRFRSIRHRSAAAIGDLPLIAVAIGPDFERGEMRGHAKGVIAIGDLATGVVALGGLARGVIAIGGLALGLVSFGGLAIGAGLAVGGMAIGSAALGGGAVGGVAIGGGAAGYYACGGGTAAKYGLSATQRDPEAEAFFRESGLEPLCGPTRAHGR